MHRVCTFLVAPLLRFCTCRRCAAVFLPLLCWRFFCGGHQGFCPQAAVKASSSRTALQVLAWHLQLEAKNQYVTGAVLWIHMQMAISKVQGQSGGLQEWQ